MKLRSDPTSATSDLYEFKLVLSQYVEPAEFLLFICNFNMTHAASGTLGGDAKVPYICTLVHGEALRHFDTMYANMEGTKPITVEAIILGFAA